MKRYLLFYGSEYYPPRGAYGLKRSFNTYQEAYDFLIDVVKKQDLSECYDEIRWGNILDCDNGEVWGYEFCDGGLIDEGYE